MHCIPPAILSNLLLDETRMPTLTEKIDSREWTTGDIAGISKKGWEYMLIRRSRGEAGWAHHAAAKSPTLHSFGDGAAIVKKPAAVYIKRVYEEDSFAGLGIGT